MKTDEPNLSILTSTIDGKPVHRRHHEKKDGRNLFLYGLAPHDLPLMHEDEGNLAKGGELRWHPYRQEWNIYAAHRQNRTFKPSAANDPLAPTKPDGPATEIPFSDFDLAVFENKFTSLHRDAEEPRKADLFKSRAATGQCEVVVYTPDSDGNLASIGQERRRLLLSAWIDRYDALFKTGCQYVLPFENKGDAVGVTLHHPHGQIYGFPYVPTVQLKMAETFKSGYCLEKEIAQFDNNYTICEAGGIATFCPPYARFPYEVWVAPQIRRVGPWAMTEEELDGLAHQLGDVCRRYDRLFKQPTPYMMSLHAAPAGPEFGFHFNVQFYPLLRAPGRVKYLASVEQSTGTFTIDVMPEMAAHQLRAL